MAGRYVLGPVIGVGSSAVVRRGRDLKDGAAVAVKLFRAGASAHDRRQQRTEIDTLAKLDHPGLVGLHDGGTTEGRPFVVTDLVEGPTLADRIAAGPVPAAEVRRLGAELADALAHVHARGIVHRDVKPANVLLGDGTGRARLADFGIARAVEGAAATTTGFVLGTAAYLAPEQVRGRVVGPPADVYALGLVLIEALTGQREYPGSAVESANARLHRPPAVPADLPEGLRNVLMAATATDPDRRPTAAAAAAALHAADVPVRAARRPVRARRRPARHRRPAGTGAAVPFVVSAVVGAVVAAVLTLAPAAPVTTVAPVPAADTGQPR